jgi:uncharacterized protein (TIGR02001 family)
MAGLLLRAAEAAAQVSGHVALLSDYVFRGESLTAGRPALQAGINYDDQSGIFVGALASNVRIDPSVSGLGAEIYGGYARPLGSRASWDVGVVSYLFPRPPAAPGYDYTEAFVGLSFDTLSARFYYSNNYFGGGARSVYAEVNGSHQISEHTALLGHVGFLGLRQPGPMSNAPPLGSALDFKAGVAIDIAKFTLELGIVGTTASGSGCPVGTGHCSTTGVVSISKQF